MTKGKKIRGKRGKDKDEQQREEWREKMGGKTDNKRLERRMCHQGEAEARAELVSLCSGKKPSTEAPEGQDPNSQAMKG